MSRLRHLEDDELLLHLEDVRHQSPIIGELCQRLEKLLRQETPVTAQAECPVCQADLRADWDAVNEILYLQVNT
jgi:hypothetical protein